MEDDKKKHKEKITDQVTNNALFDEDNLLSGSKQKDFNALKKAELMPEELQSYYNDAYDDLQKYFLEKHKEKIKKVNNTIKAGLQLGSLYFDSAKQTLRSDKPKSPKPKTQTPQNKPNQPLWRNKHDFVAENLPCTADYEEIVDDAKKFKRNIHLGAYYAGTTRLQLDLDEIDVEKPDDVFSIDQNQNYQKYQQAFDVKNKKIFKTTKTFSANESTHSK